MIQNIRTKFTFFFLTLVILWLNYVLAPNNNLCYDVFGYYLYLPFKFIYHDLGITNMDILNGIVAKYHNTDSLYQVLPLADGGVVMKYSMGMSFFYAPFFFIGHGIAFLFNYPMDGFSAPYQYSIFFGGIIYSILGIWFLMKVLLNFFSDKVSAITLALIILGSNVLTHFSMYGQGAMSHNMLFFAYALILWLTIKWHESFKIKYIIGLAVICGLSILSRPSEVVCVLIPLLWNVFNFESLKAKIATLTKYKWQILLFVIIIGMIGSFQLIYWKIYSGKFLFYSYGANAGEGFEFFSPYLYQVLFSFRKGWLLYTPIMFFAILGFVQIYKKNRFIFWSLFIYFLLNLYIVSSWSCWWYAHSYSQRSLIASYPIMAIGLGYFIQWILTQKLVTWGGGVIASLIVALNLFQSFQYYTGTLNGDRMTKAYYFKTFGKINANDEDRKLLLVNRFFDGKELFVNDGSYIKTKEFNIDRLQNIRYDSLTEIDNSTSNKLSADSIYSPGIEMPYSEVTTKDHAWLRISAWVYPVVDVVENRFCFVTQFTHKEIPYKYTILDSEKLNLKLNAWNEIKLDYLTPEVRRKDDSLKVFFWLKGKQPLFVGNIRISVYEK